MPLDIEVQDNYARALFRVAEQAGDLDQIAEEAREMADYLETHTDRRLRSFIEGPQIPDDEKHRLIRNMFSGRVHKLLVNMMCLMIDKRRSLYVVHALREFADLVDHKNEIHPALVRTATALSEDERKKMQATLEAHAGVRLRLRFKVDPTLIGGFVCQYDDDLIDCSLQTSLNEIRDRLHAIRLDLPTPEIEDN